MIGFDTLSELDTRAEERAYRLAQCGSKELVKHDLFPAEQRERIPLPPSPSLTLKAHRVILTGHK